MRGKQIDEIDQRVLVLNWIKRREHLEEEENDEHKSGT